MRAGIEIAALASWIHTQSTALIKISILIMTLPEFNIT